MLTFVEPSLWLQVQFHKHDDLLAMMKRIDETFMDLQPIFCRKVKFTKITKITADNKWLPAKLSYN